MSSINLSVNTLSRSVYCAEDEDILTYQSTLMAQHVTMDQSEIYVGAGRAFVSCIVGPTSDIDESVSP
jgi:hypothetical protein